MDYASTYWIVSLADVKTALSVDDTEDDEIIGQILSRVSEEFNEYTGRTLLASDLTEYYNGDGTTLLYLDSYPVNSTTSTMEVYVDDDNDFDADSKLASTQFWIETKVGAVKRLGDNFPAGIRNIKVVYNAGYAAGSMPEPLRGAAFDMCRQYYMARDERPDVNSISKGDTSRSFIDGRFPPGVRAILDDYKRYS